MFDIKLAAAVQFGFYSSSNSDEVKSAFEELYQDPGEEVDKPTFGIVGMTIDGVSANTSQSATPVRSWSGSVRNVERIVTHCLLPNNSVRASPV